MVRFLTAAAGCVLLLHLYGAFFPSSMNWGFHHLAFFPLIFKITIPVAMLLLLVPGVQAFLNRSLEKLTDLFARWPRLLRSAVMVFSASLLGALLWLGRERMFILGDGNVIVRTMPVMHVIGDIPLVFRNEPLSGYLMWGLWKFLAARNLLLYDGFPVQLMNTVFGLGSVILAVMLARLVLEKPMDRLLVAAFVLCSGGSQLFFGYVENYTPLYFVLVLFLLASVAFLRGYINIIMPAAVYGILFTVHFGMICMLPAVGVLLYRSIKRREFLQAAVAVPLAAGVSMVLLDLCGYTIDKFIEVFFRSGNHLLPLHEISTDWQSYTLISLRHLTELVNVQLLHAPFALLLLVVVLYLRRRTARNNHGAEWMFLLLVAACGLAFTAAVNLNLGMSRDWDVLVPFGLGSIIAAGTGWALSAVDRGVKERMMIMMAGITLLHTASWISVNADENRAMARFQTLPDTRLWGKTALTSGYEEIAIYQRNHGNYPLAIEYFTKYLQLDSSNARLWASLADTYRMTGDEENEMQNYERAIRHGSKIWEVYVNLGAIYGGRRRYDETIDVMQRAMRLNPGSTVANYLTGLAYAEGKGNDTLGLKYFLRTIELDSLYADAYLGAGICYNHFGMEEDMRDYWTKYLELEPHAQNAETIRRVLEKRRQ